MASNSGNSFDSGINRAREKEMPNQSGPGMAHEIKPGVVGNIKKNPTMGGGINRATKGQG